VAGRAETDVTPQYKQRDEIALLLQGIALIFSCVWILGVTSVSARQPPYDSLPRKTSPVHSGVYKFRRSAAPSLAAFANVSNLFAGGVRNRCRTEQNRQARSACAGGVGAMLATDWSRPSGMIQSRISDPRVVQFWIKTI